MNRNRGILAVVPLNVKLKLLAYLLGIYLCCHTVGSLIKEGQHGLVDVVVDEDNPLASTLHQTTGQLIGVVNLPVEKYALYRWQ